MPMPSPPLAFSTALNFSSITSKASSQLTGVKSPSLS